MSPKLTSTLTVTAIVLSVTAFIFTAFRIHIVMTHDTWIGIMCSLVGAAATLIVGTQIYNSITTKKQIESIQSLQKELKDKLDCCETGFKANHLFSQSLALRESQQFSALNLTIRAINYYLKCRKYSDCSIGMDNCDLLLKDIQKRIKTVNIFEYKENLDEVLEEIRNQNEYSLIKERFEKIIEKQEQLIKQIDEIDAEKSGEN